jgi:hypothetical protein
MGTTPTYLDGNATAGPLAELLTFDVTVTVARCRGCGDSMVLARCRVYSAGPGLVLRCAACECVLLRLVIVNDRAWLDMTGIACLQIDLGESG